MAAMHREGLDGLGRPISDASGDAADPYADLPPVVLPKQEQGEEAESSAEPTILPLTRETIDAALACGEPLFKINAPEEQAIPKFLQRKRLQGADGR